MPIRARCKFYRKKDPRKGVWEQVVLYVKAQDREALRDYNNKEIVLYTEDEISTVDKNSSNVSTVEKELLDALVRLFIKAYSDKTIAQKLARMPEADKVLSLLEKIEVS